MLLEAHSITKSFSGVRALRGVSLDLRAGEVHALVGENGAGKSTLIKVLTGAEAPDSGTLSLLGHEVTHLDPGAAHRLHVAAIYQQPSLFPDLTIAENIALALEGSGLWRRIDWRNRRQRAAALLAEIGAPLDPDRPASSLSMPEQQIVEIAKAIGADAQIIVMDEPTASLPRHEVDRLFSIIGRLRTRGVGIIYISHRLEEIFSIADRITVLRDGEVVAACAAESIDAARLVQLMVGREVVPAEGTDQRPAGETVLAVRSLSNSDIGLRDVSFDVKAGEIVGIAGLVGSGRTELAETLFGLSPATGGEIAVRGTAMRIDSPQTAVSLGLAYLPEDRRRHGVVGDMAVAANISLASLGAVSRWGWIERDTEARSARRYVDAFGIKTPDVATAVGQLSGGNQQKVALARWLATNPAVLILDEPTQGVDVGAKAEIHALIRQLAARGLAVVMISSELPEILSMSDRIAVMHAGTIVTIISGSGATPEMVLDHALGYRTQRPLSSPRI